MGAGGGGAGPSSNAVFGRSHCPSPLPVDQRLGLSPRETDSPTPARGSGGYGGGVGGSGGGGGGGGGIDAASSVEEIMKALNSDGLRCVVTMRWDVMRCV